MNVHSTIPAERWFYAAACVLLPVAWGLAMVWVTNRVERRMSQRRDRRHDPDSRHPEPPTVEYHI
jgi:hypothetical protein